MNRLLSVFFALFATIAFISAQTQQLPTWWKEVDHMHLESRDGFLYGTVHDKDNEHEEIIALFNNPSGGAISQINGVDQDEYNNHYYVAGSELIGDFIRILTFTPDGTLTHLHNAPEVQPPPHIEVKDIALSYDNRYLYASTNDINTESDTIEVYQITPQNTLQPIQSMPLPQQEEWYQLTTTPFGTHNFLVILSFTLPGAVGGARAQNLIVYPINAQGELGNPHAFDYRTARDPRTERSLTRSMLYGSEIHINETPITMNNQELYEIIVVTMGQRRTITDTFHLDPATGQLTLFKTEQRTTAQEQADPKDYPGYVASQYPSYAQTLLLPPNWRAQIGRYIMKMLKKEEKSLIPAGLTLRDVEKIIAEFATGTPPARPVRRGGPRVR